MHCSDLQPGDLLVWTLQDKDRHVLILSVEADVSSWIAIVGLLTHNNRTATLRVESDWLIAGSLLANSNERVRVFRHSIKILDESMSPS